MITTGCFGWYGKVPHLGDFVRSGLSGEFVCAWDSWLQQVLVTGEHVLRDRWNACYRSSPIWRFATSPGICGPNAAAGVIMTSFDRVGRKFPLCIATELPATSVSGCGALHTAMVDIFPGIESAARLMLREGAALSDLQRELVTIPDGISVPARPKQVEVGSMWAALTEGCERQLISSRMPSKPAEMQTLFDPDATCRVEPDVQNTGFS